ncbi:uncharacterized protein [Primulina huaijiensis]|uniref:uncharacterized protein n=1 Tax=Primulina huaijiensis TaxID=1492673 RepID=UPI003CC715B8
MENHNFILRISRLLSSSFASCRFRALPDVADSSISMQTNYCNNIVIPHENDSSPLIKIPEKTLKNDGFSGSISYPCRKKEVINRGSSCHSGWFSSADEKFPDNDAFFSFSSCSGESFSLRDRRPKVRCDEMKSIDEIGELRTSSSVLSASISAKIMTSSHDVITGSSRRMPPPSPPQTTNTILHETSKKRPTVTKTHKKNHDLGCDQMSARTYYSGRKAKRTRRRAETRKRFGGGATVGECLAVEKKSRNPRRDFKASMVDMILAKQSFGAEDLERLLICFLSLNSVRHHGLIFEVFSEICETLFRF